MTESEYALKFLDSALNDLIGIVSAFIMLENPNGAVFIKEKFNRAAERIRFQPYSGVAVPDIKMARAGFRMVVVEKYLMFYKVFEEEKEVVIYRILNGKTNCPYLMNSIISN